MRRKDALIYAVLIGWAGVILALSMPMVLMCMELRYQSHGYVFGWVVGAVVCCVMAVALLVGKKHKYRRLGRFFLLIGVVSLLGILLAYLKYGYELGPSPDPVGNLESTISIGS